MEKTVILQAKTLVNYGGQSYGVGMQFNATADDPEVKRLLKSGEVEHAPEKKQRGRKAEEPAVLEMNPDLPAAPNT